MNVTDARHAGRARGYLAAEVGALVGAIAGGVPGLAVALAIIAPRMFEETEDFIFLAASAIAALCATVGASVGCARGLSFRGYDAARKTAGVLAALLTLDFVLVAYSSSTSWQSDLYPPGIAAAVVAPLVARAVALRT